MITALGGEVGLLASIGKYQVSVYRKPVIAILSTGNELVSVGDLLPPGCIRDSNRPSLKHALECKGFQVLDLGIAPDTVDGIATTMRMGLEKADVLITTGGVSMGEMDLLKPVIERELKGLIRYK